MPNWCTDQLTITGAQEDLASFAKSAASRESLMDFERLAPIPHGDVAERGLAIDGPPRARGTAHVQEVLRMRVEMWKTAQRVRLTKVGKTCVRFDFETAWDPPDALLETTAEKVRKLAFDLAFYELGNRNAGRRRFESGTTVLRTDASLLDEALRVAIAGTPLLSELDHQLTLLAQIALD